MEDKKMKKSKLVVTGSQKDIDDLANMIEQDNQQLGGMESGKLDFERFDLDDNDKKMSKHLKK